MYILKHGTVTSPEKETRPIEFACHNCHCKFVAKPGEYIEGKGYYNTISKNDKGPRIKLYVSTCPECKEVIVVPEELTDFCEDRILDISEICKPGFSDKVFKLLSNRNGIQSGLYKILDFSVETNYYTIGKKYKLRLTQCDGCFTDPRTIELENLDDIELFRFDLKKPLSFMDIVSLNLGLVYVESDSRNIENGVYTVTVERGNPNDHINPFCNTSVELTKLRTDKHPKDSPNITFGYYYKPNKGLNVYCLEGSDAYGKH